jgi:hypothetical protein
MDWCIIISGTLLVYARTVAELLTLHQMSVMQWHPPGRRYVLTGNAHETTAHVDRATGAA